MGHINFNNALFNSLSKISSFQCALNRKIINEFLHLLFFLPACECLVAQSCSILCDLLDYSPPSSSVTGFLRQEYPSGLPFPSPEDLSDSRVQRTSLVSPGSPALQVDS